MRIATKTVLAFAGLVLACAGASGALLVMEAHDALLVALVDAQRLLTTNRALILSDHLALATGELERLSEMAEIDLDDGDPLPEQRVLAQAYRQTSYFNGTLELYGRRGRCRWAEPEEARCLDRPVHDTAWFREAMSSGRLRRVYVSEADGSGLVDLVAPVRREGQVVGVLRGVVDLSRDQLFSPSLRAELHPATSVALLTHDGRAVVRSGALPLDEPPLAPDGHTSPGHALADVSGQTVLVVWSPVSRAELTLVLAWPLEVLDDGAEKQVRSLSILMALVGLLAVAVGAVFAGLLTRPLRRLAAHARNIQAGTLDGLPPTARADELGDLERAFQSLLSTLSTREAELRAERDHLEVRVDERTRELRDTRDALLRAERLAALGRAGSVLSHELRNALNSVSIAVDTLETDDSEAVRSEARRLVRAEVARLRALSDDLLSVAREPTLRVRTLTVGELTEGAVLLVEDYAEHHRVRLDVSLEVAADVTLRGDPDHLQTVLINLLRNAVEAAASGPERRVRLSARTTDEQLVLRVEDDGPGVPTEIESKLFQPFVTSRAQGLGLGLAIAERFARAHGGHIARVEGTLRGACFEVRLPRSAPEERA
jgi:signal transduction histidine kinase